MTDPEVLDLESVDNHTIKVLNWNLENRKPAGVVQILHGLGEHAGRYKRFSAACNEKNLVAVAHNHRGHGTSDHRGHFADNDGWSKVLSDVLRVRQLVSDLYPRCPVVLLGHSMGSYVAQSFVMRHGGNNVGLILSGTTLASRFQLRAGNFAARIMATSLGRKRISQNLNNAGIGKFNQHFKPTRTTADWLSRDEEEVDRFIADPLCGGPYTNQLWVDLTGGLLEITSRRSIATVRKNLPMLILGGSQDPVGGQHGLQRLAAAYRRTRHDKVSLKIYAGGRHEMLNETNREAVTADIIGWIGQL